MQIEHSNTTLVKVKFIVIHIINFKSRNSNTTLVKVKYWLINQRTEMILYSNTTLVKVKYPPYFYIKEM